MSKDHDWIVDNMSWPFLDCILQSWLACKLLNIAEGLAEPVLTDRKRAEDVGELANPTTVILSRGPLDDDEQVNCLSYLERVNQYPKGKGLCRSSHSFGICIVLQVHHEIFISICWRSPVWVATVRRKAII
jgi:hypothetical protein